MNFRKRFVNWFVVKIADTMTMKKVIAIGSGFGKMTRIFIARTEPECLLYGHIVKMIK